MYNELQHHGIKGMKWGIRRTPAQLGHKVSSKSKKFTKEDGKLVGTGRKAKRQEIKDKKKEVLSSRSAKKLYENADLFTTKELQEAYNRLNLEQNIKNLAPREVNKGMQYLNTAITWGKKASEAMETGTKVYNSVARISNSLNGTKMPLIGENNNGKKTYNYDVLRNKSLSELSDDELKALNTRDTLEDRYNIRRNS